MGLSMTPLTYQEQVLIKSIFDDLGITYKALYSSFEEAGSKFNYLIVEEKDNNTTSVWNERDYDEALCDRLSQLEVENDIQDDKFGRIHRFHKRIK